MSADAWVELAVPVRRFIARRVRDPHAAEDLAQDVMLKVRTALAGSPDGPADGENGGGAAPDDRGMVAWIFRVARNALTDYYRSPRSRLPIPLEAVAEPSHEERGEDDEAEAVADLAACLRPMIARLPQPYRGAIELTELGGLSQVDLAARLGISVSGAKSRVQRGRQQLKAMLLDCCRIEVDGLGRVTGCERTGRSDAYCGGGSTG